MLIGMVTAATVVCQKFPARVKMNLLAIAVLFDVAGVIGVGLRGTGRWLINCDLLNLNLVCDLNLIFVKVLLIFRWHLKCLRMNGRLMYGDCGVRLLYLNVRW